MYGKDHNYYQEMGKRIAAMRKDQHISQMELAEYLDISVKHCSEVERGLSSLSLERLIDVCNYFDCTIDYLISGNDYEAIINELPASVLQIFSSKNKKEISLLKEYLSLYPKLRNK